VSLLAHDTGVFLIDNHIKPLNENLIRKCTGLMLDLVFSA
jgi:hypothetical protein